MRIAVTGGSGMVGRNLQDVVQEHQKEKKDDHEYVFLTRKDFDCEDRDAVMAHFKKKKYAAVVHLAACVGGLFMHIDNNQEVYERNKRINDNVIDACRESGVKRGIFCSSSCVFPPDPPSFPMDESMHLLGEPHSTNRGYANAKREMYERCNEVNELDGYEYMCLIPVNMYGKYDNFDMQNGHFIPALMHRFHLAKQAVRDATAFCGYGDLPTRSLCEEKYIAYGDGTPLRQLLYARDFAEIIYQFFLENNHAKWIYDSVIVCNDKEHTIQDVVEELALTMDLNKEKVIWDVTKANGCLRKTVSNARLLDVFSVCKFTNLNEGLKDMYSWYNHYCNESRNNLQCA